MKTTTTVLFILLGICISVHSLDNGLGLTPPMGWSTWNYFFFDINETLVMGIADKIVELGLHNYGYEYVNIDAGYLIPGRDSNNNLQVNTQKFPNGIKYVADYIHSKGLKLGVYTDIGEGSCGNGPGSGGGFYATDAMTFAGWGADYLKVDCCGTLDPSKSQWEYWSEMRDALNATGRPIYYSICPKTEAPDSGTAIPYYGTLVYSPAPNWTLPMHTSVANSILVEYQNNVDNWYCDTPPTCCIDAASLTCGMITNIDAFVQMTSPTFAGPGSWNDCDMLEVCNMGHVNGGMTIDEYIASFSMWSIFASPLILSVNLLNPNMDCLQTIIMNKEVIAIDQDPLGSAGKLVYQEGNTTVNITSQIFVRNLSSNRFAAVLFNRGTQTQKMTLLWSYLNVPATQELQVRDVWLHEDMGTFSKQYYEYVAAHSVTMIVLS